MASITQRDNGNWLARVRLRGGRSSSKTCRTKVQAQAWAASEEADIERGVQRDFRLAERTLVRDLLERYEREVAPQKKPSTTVLLHYHLARFREDFGHLRLSSLTPLELTRWRDERLQHVQSGTVRRELQSLSSVMTWVRKDLLIAMPENPVSAIRLPPPSKARDRRLEDGEEARLMAALTSHAAPVTGAKRSGKYHVGTRNPLIKPLIQLAIETAMRLGELIDLLWHDVDLVQQTAYVANPKNGDPRYVPLSKRAVAILAALPRQGEAENESVFPMTKGAAKQAWRRAVQRAGIENLRLHDQRHEATSRLAEKLPNLIELAAVTGHKDLRMLKRYYHPRAADLAKKLG